MSFRSLLLTLFSALGLLVIVPAHAATLSSGMLIKGPTDAVYYYGANGKRYVFPNEKTYKTWYADFSSVTTITADELAAIPIGGNVTYRPGVKMVKITTDPKVYAVSAHGVLRWVSTETLATQLYGADWNRKIEDVADPFFVNYTVGSPIQSATDFTPSAQTTAATDINTDIQIGAMTMTPPPPTSTTTTPPTATSTSPLTFTVSKMTAQAGDMITLTAQVPSDTAVSKIELWFDGMLQKTCNFVSCAVDLQIPLSGTKSNYVAEARLTKLSTEVISQTITLTVSTDGSSLVQLHVGQATILPSQAASAIVTVDASIGIQRIDIYADGTNVKSCVNTGHQCQWSDYLQGGPTSTHPIYAKVTDTIGRTFTSKTSYVTFGANDTPSVTVAPAKNTIYDGEYVDVTVSASDNDGIVSIDILKDGTVLQHCSSAAPCTAHTGPWSAGSNPTFTGQATDPKGAVGMGDPQTVTVVAK